jgi:hypothetical protein
MDGFSLRWVEPHADGGERAGQYPNAAASDEPWRQTQETDACDQRSGHLLRSAIPLLPMLVLRHDRLLPRCSVSGRITSTADDARRRLSHHAAVERAGAHLATVRYRLPPPELHRNQVMPCSAAPQAL